MNREEINKRRDETEIGEALEVVKREQERAECVAARDRISKLMKSAEAIFSFANVPMPLDRDTERMTIFVLDQEVDKPEAARNNMLARLTLEYGYDWHARSVRPRKFRKPAITEEVRERVDRIDGLKVEVGFSVLQMETELEIVPDPLAIYSTEPLTRWRLCGRTGMNRARNDPYVAFKAMLSALTNAEDTFSLIRENLGMPAEEQPEANT